MLNSTIISRLTNPATAGKSTRLIAVLLILLLAACSGSSKPEPEPGDLVEIKAKSDSKIDLPEQELFLQAMRQYQNSLYSVSRESFKAIKVNYPTGPYADFADLKIADSLFENAEYLEASKAYEDFAKNRPTSSAVPYALLRAGRGAEFASAGVGRDPSMLDKAISLYDSLLNKYPESVYAPAAAHYRDGVKDILARYDQQVIEFYLAQGKPEIAEIRAKEFKKNHAVDYTEYQSSEYDKRNSFSDVTINGEKLAQAKNYLRAHPPLSAQDKPAATLLASDMANDSSLLAEGRIRVTSISCEKDKGLVVIVLNPAPKTPPSDLIVEKKSDYFEFRLPEITTVGEETRTYSCFAEGDLTVSSTGVVTTKSEASSATAMYVEKPSRILLNFSE